MLAIQWLMSVDAPKDWKVKKNIHGHSLNEIKPCKIMFDKSQK